MPRHRLLRLTVNLIPEAAQAMYALSETTGLSKTDVVNRALQTYRRIGDLYRDGEILYLKAGESDLECLDFDADLR